MCHLRPAKQAHRALFLALQADAKEFPGGITELAHRIGCNKTTLANGLNPDNDTLPPSFTTILEIVLLAQAKRTVFALTQLTGQIPMDFEIENRSPAEAVSLFLSLIHSASEMFSTGSEYAKDGRFDTTERRKLEPLLMALMKACGELLQSIKGV